MFKEFMVNEVSTDMRTKTITIDFSHDIDIESIDDTTIQIMDRKTRDLIDYHFELNAKVISIILNEWPLPNQDYILKVENLKNILGDKLVSGIRKKIVFESSLCSTINIISPAYNEVIDKLITKWVEIKQDPAHELVNSYFIEVAKENNFYNVIYETLVTEQLEIELPQLDKGQYFIRCRVQEGEQYGFWSETISFLINKTPSKPESIFDSEEDEPIYSEDIKILSQPKNGETPKTIMIEFDCEIDSDYLDNIVLIRRDY